MATEMKLPDGKHRGKYRTSLCLSLYFKFHQSTRLWMATKSPIAPQPYTPMRFSQNYDVYNGSFRTKSTSYVMENFKRVYDSIKPPVWSPASSPSLSESSLARRPAVSSSLALSRQPFGLAKLALTAQQAQSSIQTNLATPRGTKPAGLIES